MTTVTVDGTDQIGVIQNAINRDGAELVLDGVCKISDSIRLCKKGLRIRAGSNGGGLQSLDSGKHLIRVSACGDLNASIRDIEMIGNGTDTTNQFAVFNDSCGGSNGVELLGLKIHDVNAGIKADGSKRWSLSWSHMYDLIGTASGRGYGFLAGGGGFHEIHDNVFHGSTGKGRHAVYLSGGASDCLVEDNFAENMQSSCYAMYSKDLPSQQPCKRNVLRRNWAIGADVLAETDAGGIEMTGKTEDCVIEYNRVINCHSIGMIIKALPGTKSTGHRVRGNMIHGSGLIGLILMGTRNVSLIENDVRDSSQTTHGVSPGIRLQCTVNTRVIENVSEGEFQSEAFDLNATPPEPVDTLQYGNSWN